MRDLKMKKQVKIRIMGKHKSNAVRTIVKEAGIPRYAGKKEKVDIIVNYGLAGSALQLYYKRFPSAKRIITLNNKVGHNKLRVMNIANKRDIKTPESKTSLDRRDKTADWIEKRYRSIGGAGICEARGRGKLQHKYYQKKIYKIYELRVHIFNWMPETIVQKRVGDPNEIAWNHRKGGVFQGIHNQAAGVFEKASEISVNVLDMLDMNFGACDFLVDKDREIYFIEVNSAPGFKELSKPIYVKAFKDLNDMSYSQIVKFI